MPDSCLLIGDIGGTNARFALGDRSTPGFSRELTLKCRDHASADAAIHVYLEEVGESKPAVICIAAAGPVIDGKVRFTNNNWVLDTQKLENAFQSANVRLLNDFEAIAYSIPQLNAGDSMRVGVQQTANLKITDFTIGIVGPGTGLGAAGLIGRGGRVYPIIGEAGHVGFAPETTIQAEILLQLRDQFERVCDERLASGPGIVNIYRALATIRHENPGLDTAAAIYAKAQDQDDALAQEAVNIFFEVLGQAAGNLALSLGAYDGVFIGGGIVARAPELIAESPFRAGFERKGRHRELMERIPTQIILHPQPGLLGASFCALQMLHG